ncbi:serine hydrolase [Salinimicrobium tongyeongense]|uniref:Serine hydrolase n=1 Tax=Salinimicrobium tongyeongense TaxID=2809707 RepID=A0ABY6NVR8_9FLAO|nr:serine hydrolase [Salinimicrobium tongyeongense]UZH56578.1 serine hydrolase [Salinimicrobium tongyeongense]
MKSVKKGIFGSLLFLAFAVGLIYLFNFEYIFKGIQATYLQGHLSAHIDDHKFFDNRKIEAGVPQPWPQHKNYNKFQLSEALREKNEAAKTIAFLIIKNDSIWHESYSEEYGPHSRTNSFSVAKSLVAALLGKAIFEGHIKSLDQPVADFFPQFDEGLTLRHLVSMSSGLNWDESYHNPFSMTIKAYLDENIRPMIMDLKVVEQPGEEFKYLSGNTQLLAMVLEKATGQNISEYMSGSFWKPLGMETYGLWQLDSEESGMEKAFCCIGSNARDFARFGKLYNDFGKWNGKQLLDSVYVAASMRPQLKDYRHYGLGIWLEEFKGQEVFYFRGILGQYVIVLPKKNIIIVRLGHEGGEVPEDKEHPNDFYFYLEEVLNSLEAHDQENFTAQPAVPGH